jgi:hypothetical protein
MKQYRFTSEQFSAKNEDNCSDAVMDQKDLNEIRRLAGLITEAEAGVYAGIGATPITNSVGSSTMSPVGSNISDTAKERNDLLEKYNVEPGTDLWFLINFSRPHLTGSLKDKVEAYLKRHPEILRKNQEY